MKGMLNASRLLLACALAWLGLALGSQDVPTLGALSDLSSNYLPAGMPQPNITLADLQRLLQQKCGKANAQNATALSENIERGAGKLFECINGLANITVIMEEVERARPRGDLDVVFEKYCRRMPQARQCLNDFNAALLPCLSETERQHNAMMSRIMDKLLQFICYKDGDQIALFIAEEGPECLEQHREHMGSCLQSSFGHYLPTGLNISTATLPDLVLGPRQCVELHDLETCVLRHLEQCSNITPSNIVEAMFRYVRKESNCQQSVDRVARDHAEALGLTGAAGGRQQQQQLLLLSLMPLTLAVAFVAA